MANTQDTGRYIYNVKKNGIRLNANEPLVVATGGTVTLPATTTIGGSTVSSLGVITSTSGNAFAVGPGGTTNPTLNVDSSASSAATGVNIASAAAASGVAISVLSSGTNENLTVDAKGSGTVTVNGTATGNVVLSRATGVSGALTVTSTSPNALSVGAAGATNSAFKVDNSTSSQAAGLKVTGAVTGGTVALAAIDSGSNTAVSVNGKGSGALLLGNVSTGQVSIGRGGLTSIIESSTIGSLGTTQNSTPTAAQLLGGVVTQTSATGAGTVTLPTGTQLSTAVTGAVVGDTFDVMFANLGGGQTLTITGATGSTVIGTAAVGTGKNAFITFVNTGSNTWNVYVVVSA